MKISKRMIQIILVIACLISLLAVIMLARRYSSQKRSMLEEIKTEAQFETHAAAQKIGQFVGMLQPLVQTFTEALNKKELTPDEINLLLSQKPDAISGVGICFAPNTTQKLHAPYCVEKDGHKKAVNSP